jgi:hypothetical protein
MNRSDDTRLWGTLQLISSGMWGRRVYDIEAIMRRLQHQVLVSQYR